MLLAPAAPMRGARRRAREPPVQRPG
jgi:hypothetical protein